MGALDCNTEQGRVYIGRQKETASIFAQRTNCDYAMTPDDQAGVLDTFFFRDRILCNGAEVKARNMTLADLKGYGDYLVTFEKLVRARDVTMALHIPFWLIVGLYGGDSILRHIVSWQITDANGYWVVELHNRLTETQATCNGGTAIRMNSYITFDRSRLITVTP